MYYADDIYIYPTLSSATTLQAKVNTVAHPRAFKIAMKWPVIIANKLFPLKHPWLHSSSSEYYLQYEWCSACIMHYCFFIWQQQSCWWVHWVADSNKHLAASVTYLSHASLSVSLSVLGFACLLITSTCMVTLKTLIIPHLIQSVCLADTKTLALYFFGITRDDLVINHHITLISLWCIRYVCPHSCFLAGYSLLLQ